jgi:hypothetical protein
LAALKAAAFLIENRNSKQVIKNYHSSEVQYAAGYLYAILT